MPNFVPPRIEQNLRAFTYCVSPPFSLRKFLEIFRIFLDLLDLLARKWPQRELEAEEASKEVLREVGSRVVLRDRPILRHKPRIWQLSWQSSQFRWDSRFFRQQQRP